MRTAIKHDKRGNALDCFGPLFGEAWTQKPLDLMSDQIKGLAATGLLNPRGMKPSEIQALAAAVMAYVVDNEI